MTRRSHHVDLRSNNKGRKRRRQRLWLKHAVIVGVYGCYVAKLERMIYKPIKRIPCHWCKVMLTRSKFDVDRLIVGGSYRFENVVPSCTKCNRYRRPKGLI